MQTSTVFEKQMLLTIFDTQFGTQGMENIGEIWYYLVPFLTQGGPSRVLVLIASNGVYYYLMASQKDSHVGVTTNIEDSSMALFSK
jgi:hypothetical protein